MTFAPAEPAYSWGMGMIALDDLYNDGSYPGCEPDGCLVEAGSLGRIVNVGQVVENGEPVYLVEFGKFVVGCTQDEIAPAPQGLLPERGEAA